MDVARIREGIRKMRFSCVFDRWEAGEIGQAAAELLGMSVRSLQRWKDRYEASGEAGLVDRRGGPSRRRAPQEELERMLGLYRDKYGATIWMGDSHPDCRAATNTPTSRSSISTSS